MRRTSKPKTKTPVKKQNALYGLFLTAHHNYRMAQQWQDAMNRPMPETDSGWRQELLQAGVDVADLGKYTAGDAYDFCMAKGLASGGTITSRKPAVSAPMTKAQIAEKVGFSLKRNKDSDRKDYRPFDKVYGKHLIPVDGTNTYRVNLDAVDPADAAKLRA